MAVLRKLERHRDNKKNAHVGVLLQKRYHVTLLKRTRGWHFPRNVPTFSEQAVYHNNSEQPIAKGLYFLRKPNNYCFDRGAQGQV